MRAAVAAFALLCSSTSFAIVKVEAPIRVSTEVEQWNRSYAAKVAKMKAEGAYPADGYTECRETLEIRGAHLCIWNTQKGMNSALGRASFYVEGLSGQKNVVVPQSDSMYQQYKTMIGGHDLKGSDLLRFEEAANQTCQTSARAEDSCMNSYEIDIFNNFITPNAKRDPNFVVITYASQSSMRWQDVVTHEIMHAQYFNDSRYREICDDFWATQVSSEDKKMVVSILGRHYDANDALLMKNEFQAYILMEGANVNMLGGFVRKYREPLMKNLLDAGVQPIQVK